MKSPSAAMKHSCPAVRRREAQQHFAVVLDDQVITAPSIDYPEYPEGIDATPGRRSRAASR